MQFTKEIKEKWLIALKSGDYKRNKGSLENDNKNCCLGVLGKELGFEITKDGLKFKDEEKDSNILYPKLVSLLNNTIQWNLANANDERDKSDLSYNCVIPLIEQLETVD